MNKNKIKSEIIGLHSITFYMPSNRIDFFNKALRKVSNQIYGDGKRMVSKYIRELIYRDLQTRGFLDSEFNPVGDINVDD